VALELVVVVLVVVVLLYYYYYWYPQCADFVVKAMRSGCAS
jgi:hypothetical protein